MCLVRAENFMVSLITLSHLLWVKKSNEMTAFTLVKTLEGSCKLFNVLSMVRATGAKRVTAKL